MSFAYDVTSGAALALLGVFAILIAVKCVEVNWAERGERSLHLFLWEIAIGALTAGTSPGYTAAVLFVVGIAFIAIGGVVVVSSVIWALF